MSSLKTFVVTFEETTGYAITLQARNPSHAVALAKRKFEAVGPEPSEGFEFDPGIEETTANWSAREVIPPKRYRHLFSIAFTLESTDPTGENVPADELRAELRRRLAGLGDDNLLEAVGLPEDTYEVPSP